RLVSYRNQLTGHGAVGMHEAAFYERMGQVLLAGVPEVLARLDVLAGRRLAYVGDVRRQASGRWLVERYELKGESACRLPSLDLPEGEAVRQLLPERVYLQPLDDDEAGAGRLCCLHPLVVFDPEQEESLFLNSRKGKQRLEYLCYTSGKVLDRAELG